MECDSRLLGARPSHGSCHIRSWVGITGRSRMPQCSPAASLHIFLPEERAQAPGRGQQGASEPRG
eukprot:675666-Hanusia_phi.AAC.1